MYRLTIMVLCSFTFALALCAADWPQFAGPQANSFSPETGINTDWAAHPPRELWRVPLHDDGYAGPSVAEGKVFIIDHERLADGAFGKHSIVRALNFADGKEVWRFVFEDINRPDYGFAHSTPAYSDGLLYVLGRRGQFFCLNAQTGQPVWQKNIIAEFKGRLPGWGLAMSPLIDGERVVLVPGSANGTLVVLNKRTGALVWQGGGSDAPGYATPVIATIEGTRQYVVFAAKNLIGVNTDNGALLWSHPWHTAHDVNAALPLVMGADIFITSNYRKGGALVSVAGGEPTARWQNTIVQSHFSSPIYHEGFIYSTSDPGFLTCLDPATGEARWRERGFEKGGLVGVDGTMIVLDGRTGDAVMVRLTPEAYQEMGRIKPLGGQSWTAPIIAHGRLLIRNKSALVCLDISAP